MTRKLEALFDLAPPSDEDIDTQEQDIDEEAIVTRALVQSKNALSHIEEAMPAVKELAAIDDELDEIAKKAMTGYEDLADLGMQVDSRFAAEIFSVAATMMSHAISAKTAKATRKLKTIDLQMKKAKLAYDLAKEHGTPRNTMPSTTGELPMAEGQILSRNELMAMVQGNRGASSDTEK